MDICNLLVVFQKCTGWKEKNCSSYYLYYNMKWSLKNFSGQPKIYMNIIPKIHILLLNNLLSEMWVLSQIQIKLVMYPCKMNFTLYFSNKISQYASELWIIRTLHGCMLVNLQAPIYRLWLWIKFMSLLTGKWIKVK